MSNVIPFPGCKIPDAEAEAIELDHATREAQAATALAELILARNRHSLACPDAEQARKVCERIANMREGLVKRPCDEFDSLHLLNLRVAHTQIQWLLDRIERKQARLKPRSARG